MGFSALQLASDHAPSASGGETSRAFYQARVVLFFFVIGGLTLVFFMLHNVLEVLSGDLSLQQVFTASLNHWHLAGVAVAAAFGATALVGTPSLRALRIGRFEAAHGGTLFLDELGNLSANGQMKLLRVLQSGELERVGSSTTRQVDVRVLSATHADLLPRSSD